jgi:ATP-dependent exoDNAse (exonuclease V) beta subunit
MSRSDASRYLDPERNLCAIKLGGWAPHELHDHEAEEVERDAAEGIRLAYVAATRARDLLVVPAVGDEPWDGGWLSPLNGALYPDAASRRTAARGPKCPAFKSKDTVLQRPNDEPATPMTVCPGLHEFPGGYSVVWWDPAALGPLDLKPQMGVRRDDLIVKDVARNVVADGRTKYDTWKLGRITARERGSIPAMKVQTVREHAAAEATNEATEAQRTQSFDLQKQISVISVPQWLRDRPSGPAFGSLVHNVLARTPFDATRDGLENIAAIEARLLALDDAEATAAAAVVERVLGHELLQRARRAFERGACRRETPVTLTLDDGTLVEGVVDLAFEENGQWTVVDYKTDREIAERGEEQYRRQLGVYAAAIAKATGASTSAVLVRI